MNKERQTNKKEQGGAKWQSRDETANLEPRVSVVEGHERTKQFVIVEGWTRKANGARKTMTHYLFEKENFDDARTYFWSQVFNDQESLWRLIDYAR